MTNLAPNSNGTHAFLSSCEEYPARIIMAQPDPEKRAKWLKMLGQNRYEITSVSTTSEAIAVISAGPVDLLLLDYDTPEIGAVDLCHTLKKANATRFLPVFVFSAVDSAEREVNVIEAGAAAFLLEPIREASLHARIQASLQHRVMIESLDDSESVLFSLAESVEERDPDLGQHCERLAQICSAMGLELGLPPEDIATLQRAGYLHDIGKVAIPDNILFKKGPLTPGEWQIMESHAERGERICRNIRSLGRVLPVIRHHHEKWNGTGYPDRLKGEEIPLLARILQLADIYDALTTERPYKRAFSPEEAVQIIRDEAAKGWRDPVLTERFVDLLPTFRMIPRADLSQMSLRALAASLRKTEKETAPAPVSLPL